VLYSNTATPLELGTNGVVRLTISSAGAVSIPGTLAAGATTVTGTLSATGTSTLVAINASGKITGTANVWSEGAGSDTAATGNLFMLSNGAGGGSARYWATQQSSSGAAKVDYYFNGTSWAQISSVSSTGLAVTGTLSATTTGQVGTTLGVGAATPSASGAGITFPATQSASTDANTLDDYEEGTWTPGQGGGLTVVGAYASSGKYVKIGRQVFVSGAATATTIAASANLIGFTGLPFANSGTAGIGSMSNASLSQVGATYSDSTNVYVTAMTAAPSLVFSLVYHTT
jgi:hypothetical protein